MSRPAVLIVEPDSGRRQELSHALAADGYEVVPTSNAEEGQRFALGLGPAVIVAPAELSHFGDGSILSALTAPAMGMDRTLVLLGENRHQERDLPSEVIFLATAGLATDELARRIRLVLVGREIGVEPDARLESLVGDLGVRPLLELLRALHHARFTGGVQFERGGALYCERGEIVAARAGKVRGLKAFCRLGRLSEEPFRIVFGPPGVERELHEELNDLIIAAIKDSVGEFPDPRQRVALEMREGFFEESFGDVEQAILQHAHRGATVDEVLDGVDVPDGEVVRKLLRLEERGILSRRAVDRAVTIVTDSTADLPPALASAHGIEVVPLGVHFADEVYRDRVDLMPGEFYRKLEEHPAHPQSSPPSAETFAALYRRALESGDVVSIHLSSRLSKTCENARQAAAAELKAAAEKPARSERRARAEVLDSGHISLSLGLLALFAARMALRGGTAEEIGRRLADMRRRMELFFAVDTLEYLARGGRIGKAQAFVGGLLRIKPILGLVDGEVAPLDRVMGRRAIEPRLVEMVAGAIDPARPIVLGITHALTPVWADRLRAALEERFLVSELVFGETGPVIGTHVGPGAFSVVVFQPRDDEQALIAPLA